jgi:uncharacterized repeat protein (TIGR03803 family)
VSVILAQFVAMTMLVIGARAASTTTVVYAFSGGADGEYPDTHLAMDNAGNLYGATVAGGSGPCESGCGVVYKLTHSSGVWTESVIRTFAGSDGSGP